MLANGHAQVEPTPPARASLPLNSAQIALLVTSAHLAPTDSTSVLTDTCAPKILPTTISTLVQKEHTLSTKDIPAHLV